jgi:hypothetical protein
MSDQFLNEEGEEVYRSETPIEYGYRTRVVREDASGNFWSCVYTVENNGDFNGLRDGVCSINQVYPHTESVIVYRTENPNDAS